MSLLLAPLIIALLILFRTETQMAINWNITQSEMIFYLLFVLVMLPFLSLVDVLIMNMQELVHFWKIFDYLTYLQHTFTHRSEWWQMHSIADADRSVPVQFRSLAHLCFSSQYNFIILIHTTGMCFCIVATSIYIHSEYSPFNDVVTPLLLLVVLAYCVCVEHVSLWAAQLFGLWPLLTRRTRVHTSLQSKAKLSAAEQLRHHNNSNVAHIVPQWSRAYKQQIEVSRINSFISDTELTDIHLKKRFTALNCAFLMRNLREIIDGVRPEDVAQLIHNEALLKRLRHLLKIESRANSRIVYEFTRSHRSTEDAQEESSLHKPHIVPENVLGDDYSSESDAQEASQILTTAAHSAVSTQLQRGTKTHSLLMLWLRLARAHDVLMHRTRRYMMHQLSSRCEYCLEARREDGVRLLLQLSSDYGEIVERYETEFRGRMYATHADDQSVEDGNDGDAIQSEIVRLETYLGQSLLCSTICETCVGRLALVGKSHILAVDVAAELELSTIAQTTRGHTATATATTRLPTTYRRHSDSKSDSNAIRTPPPGTRALQQETTPPQLNGAADASTAPGPPRIVRRMSISSNSESSSSSSSDSDAKPRQQQQQPPAQRYARDDISSDSSLSDSASQHPLGTSAVSPQPRSLTNTAPSADDSLQTDLTSSVADVLDVIQPRRLVRTGASAALSPRASPSAPRTPTVVRQHQAVVSPRAPHPASMTRQQQQQQQARRAAQPLIPRSPRSPMQNAALPQQPKTP